MGRSENLGGRGSSTARPYEKEGFASFPTKIQGRPGAKDYLPLDPDGPVYVVFLFVLRFIKGLTFVSCYVK